MYPPTVTLPDADMFVALMLPLVGTTLPVPLYRLVLLLAGIVLDIFIPYYLTE